MSNHAGTAERTPLSPLRQPHGLRGPRRARAACNLCRWRKVRCNAQNGQPCSNCTFEDVQCVMAPKQRRREATKISTKRQRSHASINADVAMTGPPSSATYIEHTQRRMCETLSAEETLEGHLYPEPYPEPYLEPYLEPCPAATQLGLSDLDNLLVQDLNDESTGQRLPLKAFRLRYHQNPQAVAQLKDPSQT